jgi:hypothetical protein
MVDDRGKRGGQAVASNTAIGAVLDSGIGNNKIVEDAFAENANSVGARQCKETSQSHSLKLDSALGKNIRDAAKG